MALRFPARVRSSTSTTGSGTYTLTEPSVVGFRNLTRAVVDGDLASGDEVVYAVADLTVTGGPSLVEIGRGVYDNAAKTLTRATVYQPNGTAISWGAGTRDVLVIDPVVLAVLTQGDQTVAGIKTFSSLVRAQISGSAAGVDGTTALVAQRSGSAADACRVSIIAGNAGFSELTFGDTDAQFRGRVAYNHATERLDLYTGGTLRVILDTILKDAAGNPYISFPVGGRLLWGTNSIPPGWSIVGSLADRIILTTSTASEIDDVGGSWTISGVTIGNTTLTIAQMPAHVHTIKYDPIAVTIPGGFNVKQMFASGGSTESAITAAGSDGAHSHSFAQDGAWRPLYYKAGWIAKS